MYYLHIIISNKYQISEYGTHIYEVSTAKTVMARIYNVINNIVGVVEEGGGTKFYSPMWYYFYLKQHLD